MGKTIHTLDEFLQIASKNRKYPPNTVHALKAALNLFASELNEDEQGSIDLFKQRLGPIYQNVVAKNKLKFTSSSLDTYLRRIKRLLRDYELYGVDVTKMASWNPTEKPTKSKKTSSSTNKTDSIHVKSNGSASFTGDSDLVPLPSGIKVMFPDSLKYNVAIGDFSEEIKSLEKKAREISDSKAG